MVNGFSKILKLFALHKPGAISNSLSQKPVPGYGITWNSPLVKSQCSPNFQGNDMLVEITNFFKLLNILNGFQVVNLRYDLTLGYPTKFGECNKS